MRFDPQNYIDVQERINGFLANHPDGAILTELVSPPGQFDQVVFKAEVYKHRDDARPSATGWAAEERGQNVRDGANFTSWHENGETSAIGRALANLGMAKTREDRPSRQEMEKVNRGHDAHEEGGRAANTAPVSERQQHATTQSQGQQGTSQGVTPSQLRFIHVLAKEAGIDEVDLFDEAMAVAGVSVGELDKRGASALIERLQSRKTVGPAS